LDIKPGSKVIEAGAFYSFSSGSRLYVGLTTARLERNSGTGSGSFSHSVARSVGQLGKVHSFEYHEERFTKAK